jgi:hypothetical protein
VKFGLWGRYACCGSWSGVSLSNPVRFASNVEIFPRLKSFAQGRGTQDYANIGFKVHPHMLRHARGYALAYKGIDTCSPI